MARLVLLAAISFLSAYFAFRWRSAIPPHADPSWVQQSDVGWDSAYDRGRVVFVRRSRLPTADALLVGDSRAGQGLRVRTLFPEAERAFALVGVGTCGRLATLERALTSTSVPASSVLFAVSVALIGPDGRCPAEGAKDPYALASLRSPLRRFERVPRRGNTSWFRPDTGEEAVRALLIRPRFSDGAYRSLLAAESWSFEAGLAAAVRGFEGHRDAGRTVWVVRMPIDPGLRALEDAALSPEHFARAMERAGLPYLDLGVTDETYDGSHLTWQAAERVSARVAAWMKRAPRPRTVAR